MSVWTRLLPRTTTIGQGDASNQNGLSHREWIDLSLKELIVDSLLTLLPVTLVLLWVWAVVRLLTSDIGVPLIYAAMAISALTSGLCYRWHRSHLSRAVSSYLMGLLAVVSLVVLIARDDSALLLYLMVILVTAMLTNARVLALMTLVCAIGIAVTGIVVGISWQSIIFVELLAMLTSLTAWLGSRRLFTALQWSLSMSAEAQRHAEEARWHRGEVQRVLKNLDEAYVRLEHTNQALLLARESAEKAYRFKSEFVVNVSHELRTPLNLIIGFSEMMATAPESYSGVQLPREYRGDIMAIYRSAKHLAELINDVLDLSQIEAGRMPIHKTPTDLAGVVRESVEIVRGLIEARGLVCEVLLPETLPLIELDRTRIRQVLLNLLTNATRFTDHGFIRASVQVMIGDAGETEAIVRVQDSGRGIPSEKLDNAFEAFSRLHESQIRDGSGMGLAVSREFVALHGGRMWIQSVMGQGTTVSFALPISQSPIAEMRHSAAAPVPSGARVVLVLHDDDRSLALLHRYVEGFEFVLVSSFNEVPPMLAQTQLPYAVLADSTWMNRHHLTQADLGKRFAAPVLQLPLPGLRRIGAQLGAHDYLTKPVTREVLLASLHRLPNPPQTILVVDNDPHVVRLLVRMIRAEMPEATIFESFGGHEALAILQQHHPDVMLLDLLMPDMNGYDVMAKMRVDASLDNTAVIIVTARGEEDEDAPVQGGVHLYRSGGHSTTQLLHLLSVMLAGVDGQGE